MNAEVKDVAPVSTAKAMKLSDDLTILQNEIVKVLPEHVGADRFMRVVATAIAMSDDLRKADRRSLFTAAVKAATDGLVPDGREGAFVVYGSTVQWMPMTAGILKKVRNSGELKSIFSNVVYEKDTFRYWIDDDGEHIQHEPNVSVAERGAFRCAYAIAKTLAGGVYTEVMSSGQINQVRGVSKAGNRGPWKDWPDEMARKSVIRRLSKRLPMSTDLEQVLQRDNDHYDLDRAKTQQASGGVSAARQALGMLSQDLVSSDRPEAQEQASGAGYVPQYTADTAIAEIKGTTTVAQLAGLVAQISDDFEKSQRDLPIEVEAATNDHRIALEQQAEQPGKERVAGKGKRS